jgi:hypothetical protein
VGAESNVGRVGLSMRIPIRRRRRVSNEPPHRLVDFGRCPGVQQLWRGADGTGRINVEGLFRDKNTQQVSPARVQAFVTSALGTTAFFLGGATSIADASLPAELALGAVGGGNLLYLASKALSTARSIRFIRVLGDE